MADELMEDSQFSDGNGNEMYSSYLKSETDRLALASKECHLEKILKHCHAHWLDDASRKETTSNLVLEDLKCDKSFSKPQIQEMSRLILYGMTHT